MKNLIIIKQLLLSFFPFISLSISSGAAIIMQPYLQAVTTNSIYVMVECNAVDTVVISYGTSVSFGYSAKTSIISTTTNSPATYVHKIHLTGLLTNTLYYYMATQGSSVSNTHSFTTAVDPGTPFRMAWMADCRTGTSVHDQISSLISTYNPKFSCYGGDLCVNSNYSSWKNEFFRPSELNLISQVPFFNAPGNHETWGTNTKAFTRNPDSPSNTQDYYSFDYGDVHFLCINNQVDYAVNSPQYNFALSDLQATTKTWKIVFNHNPAYCSGKHGEDLNMIAMSQNIFAPFNVDLVITGHSHFYQHNYVDGVHHAIVGDAGSPQYDPYYAPYTVLSFKDYNFGIIDVTANTLVFNIYNNLNQKIDSIKLIKPPSSSGPLNGVKKIGPALCDFLSLTQAFEYLRTEGNGINGSLTLELSANYTTASETFPITMNSITGSSSANIISIRPEIGATGLSISSNNKTGTLNLNGIDHVIIDGRPGGSGISQLTIENQGDTGYAVQFINDAINNSIQYCTIKGINASSLGGLVFFSTTTLTSGNDDNVIDHCILRDGASAPVYLVYSKGTDGKANSSNTISNSELCNFSSSAIYLSSTGNGNTWVVTGNSFYNNMPAPPASNITVIRFGSSSSANNLISGNFIGGQSAYCGGSAWPVNGTVTFYGIWVTASTISKNKICNIGSPQTGSSPVIYGIYNSGTAGVTNEFSDNMISLDGGIASNPTLCGFYDNGASGGTYNLFSNSINIHGNATISSSTYAIRLNNGSAYTLKNNIFSNRKAAGGSGGHYAIYCSAAGTFTSDYNDLFSIAGPLGYYNSASQTTLSAWQAATGGDLHSLNFNPSYKTNDDLHIQWDENLNDNGISIPFMTTDYDGNTRGNPPDPGINEFSLTLTWTGAISSQWHDPGNWTPTGVPIPIQNVVIPSGISNYPVVTISGIICNNMTIKTSAMLTIPTPTNVRINGDLIIENGASFLNLGNLEINGNFINEQ